LINDIIIAIEVDENAHKSYDSTNEEIRYNDLYMIHSGKWIFIRFNPDITKNCKIDLEDRIPILLEEIESQIYNIIHEFNNELVQIVKLFY
jgi:hypothetical protein